MKPDVNRDQQEMKNLNGGAESTFLIDMLKTIMEQIEQLKQPVATQTTPWMTITEAAEYTRASTRSLRRWVAENKIPYIRRDTESGKAKLFFHRKMIDYWMFTGSTKPTKKQREPFAAFV